MSINSSGPAVPATQADLSQVLDFGAIPRTARGDFGADRRPARGGFQYDQEFAGYDLSWGSLAEFDAWRQDQKSADTIDLVMCLNESGSKHFSWRRVYWCSRHGSGGIKPYDKKYPDRIRKFGTKRIGCPCKLDLKAYPGTNVLLGRYLKTHSHPTGMGNIVHTRLSEKTRRKVRELLELHVERSAIVRDFRLMPTRRLG